jgi:hypothetical protein
LIGTCEFNHPPSVFLNAHYQEGLLSEIPAKSQSLKTIEGLLDIVVEKGSSKNVGDENLDLISKPLSWLCCSLWFQ